MGYRTVVVLNNDFSSSWEKDAELGRKIFLSAAAKASGYGHEHPFPYGDVVEQVHADTQSLVVCDGYSGEVAAQSYWQRGDTSEAVELRLLKELAEKHGFDLRRKPGKKQSYSPRTQLRQFSTCVPAKPVL